MVAHLGAYFGSVIDITQPTGMILPPPQLTTIIVSTNIQHIVSHTIVDKSTVLKQHHPYILIFYMLQGHSQLPVS